MLRIAFALMAGIGLAIAFGNNVPLLMLAVIILAIAVTASIILNLVKDPTASFRNQRLQGYSLIAAIAACGYVLAYLHMQNNYSDYFARYLEPHSILIARIDEPPVEREKVFMAAARVQAVLNDSEQVKTGGSIQLSFVKDSSSAALRYGDVLLVKGRIDSFDLPKNPSEFNYKRYQEFHNLYEKIYLQKSNWQKIDSAGGIPFFAAVFGIRNSFLQIVRKYIRDKNDFGVASAIMLGYRDYINGQIMRAYAGSGTLHVLSVSGLHVAVMFIMLSFLLKWMDGRGRKMEIAKAVIIISFIWFYAVLTGMSPPVMRSAMMFSLIQVGRVMARNVNTYNIIAGSAILLMLWDPFVIMDVGFELSYLAVIGIIYLYPKVSGLIPVNVPKRPKKLILQPLRFSKWVSLWLADFVWQLTAVSIAAELATLPLSLYYFYQFPNLFIVSNLVVIPMSDFVLFSGTALFAGGHMPYLNTVAGWIFSHLIAWLDKFIFWIGHLPFALTHALSIGPMEMALMYLLLLLVCWLTVEQRSKILLASLSVLLILCSFSSYRFARNSTRGELIVYSVPKEKAIAFIEGRKVFYDFDNALWNDSDNMAFHIWHHWSDCGINKEVSLESAPSLYNQLDFGKWVSFEGKRILIIDSALKQIRPGFTNKLNADIIILSGNPEISIAELQKLFSWKQVVFDSSNETGRVKRWKSECSKLGVQCYDVAREGAFIMNL